MTMSSVTRLGLGLLALLAACANPDSLSSDTTTRLSPELPWFEQNRLRLDAMIEEHGRGGAQFDATAPPVAIFDWDNTVIKNDIGDATVFYMLRTGAVLQPPDRNWRLTSSFLTADAAQALSGACDGIAAPGERLPTHQAIGETCATEIVTVYTTAQTTGKKAAFAGWNYRRMEPAYAWAAQLLAGYGAEEARRMGERALQAALVRQQGATQTIGVAKGLTAWLRFYPQMRDLIAVLKARGFDVWVVSASPQQIVEAAASHVGIQADRVIGIRLLERDGKLTASIAGCGDVADGANELITYIEGKRCWINKVIFGVSGGAAMQRQMDLAKRQVFAAGDSDTDVSFLQDATGLRLVLNRNKKELMCNAYANAHGTWIVNPMFIEPLPQRVGVYSCATNACKDAAGNGVACVNEDGGGIADQNDTVFVAPVSP